MDIKQVVLSGVGVVIGIIILTIADAVNAATYTGYAETLTQTVMSYVPTLFGIGILLGSVWFGIKGLSK